ncbi:MAG TPA: hypothetical protein VH482_24830 [Thermomicrobiales bacterium]
MPAGAEVPQATAPLGGAVEIADALATDDQPAAGEPDRVEIGDLARGGDGRCLVEEAHPIVDPAGVDQGEPFEGEGDRFEIGIAKRAGDRRRFGAALPGGDRVVGDRKRQFPLADQDESVLGGERQTVEEATGALDPTAGDGGFAAKGVGVPGQPEGDPRRPDPVAVVAIAAISALAGVAGEGRVVEPVGGEAESFEGLGRFLARDRPFEAVARVLPGTTGEGGVTGGEGIVQNGDGSG